MNVSLDELALITLTEAAKIMPGRPSTNCIWRWCRKGVLSRGGERVRLQHRRVGGKIFTTRNWLDEFGKRLAEADTDYFDLRETAAREAAAMQPRMPRQRRIENGDSRKNENLREVEDAEKELDEAGIR